MTMLSSLSKRRAEELRQAGLTKVRENNLEEAIGLYDEALALTNDEEIRELITINKADAMIGLERSGPEVQELARVIMRRRNPRHVCLAAYALQYKNRLEGDLKRALFYGQLALRSAEECNEDAWRRAVLVDLGNVYEMDSQIALAIEYLEKGLELIPASDANQRRDRGYTIENLGYCKLLDGNIDEGIALIESSLEYLDDHVGTAEAHIDLCYGYLEKGDLEKALHHGEAGLESAAEPRQVRNVHYLLGEVFYKSGDSDRAEEHFEQLARYYPGFRNLKSLLFAIDLRGMVNLKL
jgi:tetratricopeptide (TPR) repeat protein